MREAFFPLLLSVLLAGCHSDPLIPPVGSASFRMRASVEETTRTQSVTKCTKASINHLLFKLFTLDGAVEEAAMLGGSQISRDLRKENLDDVQIIGNLKPDTTYRVRSYAYKAAGTDACDLISTGGADCYTDVVVTNDDAPALSLIKVKLIDVPFAGLSTGSIDVLDGGYSAAASVSMAADPI